MPVRIEFDVEKLRDLIETQKLQQHEVARILSVSRETIGRACRRFHLQTQRTGPKSGEQHPGWKGGRKLVKGYVYLYRPDHPNATRQGYVSEHRLVMEDKLGRLLESHEVVHHLNDTTDDNRPENLDVYATNAAHLAATRLGKMPRWTPEGLERIRTGLTKRANQLRSGIGAPPRNRQTGRFQATPGKPSRQA